MLIETKLESVSPHNHSQSTRPYRPLTYFPPAVSRKSWRITGGAGRCCLQAYTWATWSCVHRWSRSEHWCPRNSPTSSVTPKFGTTVTCPGGDHMPLNVGQCLLVCVCMLVKSWLFSDTWIDAPFIHSCECVFYMCVVLERSGSGCRLSALWRSRWKWTMKYRVLHIAFYRTCAAPSRTWWHI